MQHKVLHIRGMWKHQRLEQLIGGTGISYRDLAKMMSKVDDDRIHTSHSTVARWVSGESVPNFCQAVWLANHFKVDVCEFGPCEQPHEAGRPSLAPEEQHMLRIYRSWIRQGMTPEDIDDMLISPKDGTKKAVEGQLVADQDLSAPKEPKPRLGFELDEDLKASEGNHGPIPRRHRP
jgi:transcriptional regulator with XRE-family HTH domain